MRSRHATTQRKDENGNLEPLLFQDSDLELCRLLSPNRFTREPWSYQYLPAEYIALLLGRGPQGTRNRLQELKDEPHAFIELPNQPTALSRPLIYSIGRNGIHKLREHGYSIPRTELRGIRHEFMASLIAASFEYASQTIPGVSIEIAKQPSDHPYPDWPVFTLTTPALKKRIFIEAETGSQSYPDVEGKFEAYLDTDLTDTLVLFYAAKSHRIAEWNERLKKTVIRVNKPKSLARFFGFIYFPFDPFLFKIPKLSTWAVTGSYLRPAGPFTLVEK